MRFRAARTDSRHPRIATAAMRCLIFVLLASDLPAIGAGRPSLLPVCPDADADSYAVCSSGCDANGFACGDCDDASPAVHPGAPETCNHRDDDCDGFADEGSTRRITAVTTYDPDPRTYGAFGTDAAVVGDVDGDGLPDLAVSRPYGPGVRGLVLLSGSDRSVICTMAADEPQGPEGTGAQVAGIGDVNGDGVPDVATVAPATQWMEMGEVGSLSIFSGADCSLLRKCIDPLGQTGDRLGAGYGADGRLESFTDLNGDGIPEVAVGAPSRFGPNGSGTVLLFSPADCTVTGRIEPPDPTAEGSFGHSLAAIPDLTGDGIIDLVVGEPDWQLGRGAVHVYSGAGLSLVWTITDAPGNRNDDLLGFVVDGMADITGDGVPDLVASAMGDDQYRGSIMIYNGATGEFVRKVFDPAGADDEQLGRVVAVTSDMTGDGYPDILAGFLPDWGVIVFDSRTGSVAHRLYAPNGGVVGFGGCVVPAVDLSGDGQQDLVVCSQSADLPGDPSLTNVGSIVVLFDDSDCDGDGSTLFEGDCTDGGVISLPLEVHGLEFAGDSITLSWSQQEDPRGTSGLLYDVFRSTGASSFSSAVCFEADGADRAATDAEQPAEGSAFFYQVRAQNPCGQGSLGTTNTGLPRVGPACP